MLPLGAECKHLSLKRSCWGLCLMSSQIVVSSLLLCDNSSKLLHLLGKELWWGLDPHEIPLLLDGEEGGE